MKPNRSSKTWELAALALLVAAFNAPLLFGGPDERFVLFPERLWGGQWHLLITHAFVHVGSYHLWLDAGAFLALYAALGLANGWQRGGVVVGGILGSAVATLLAWPAAAESGLCGLSGVAHGLMAVCGVEILGNERLTKAERWAGAAALCVVVAKGAVESATGQVYFGGWHVGYVGSPVAVCHAGGIAGALAAYAVAGLWLSPVFARVQTSRQGLRTDDGAAGVG